MEPLKLPIRKAMRRDPSLIHRAFSLEARIAMAEIRGRQDELQTLIGAYDELSKRVRKEGDRRWAQM
jgi:hypothetical protein